MTPFITPRADGEGKLGTQEKRWGEGWFSGRIHSRGQIVNLKYFVSDQATRYDMSGFDVSVRPEDGDLVYQVYPSILYLVVDDNNLGNLSGYYAIASVNDLGGKLDVVSGSATGLSLRFGDVVLRPSADGNGCEFYSLPDSGVSLRVSDANLYIDNLTSGRVVVLDESGRISSSPITTGELFSLSGISGNLQGQLDNLFDLYLPAGTDLSIQYNDSGVFGGDTFFKYSRTGAFGYSPYGLRGAFDVRRPYGSFALTGLIVSVTPTGGSAYTDTTVGYNIYPYLTITGEKYYSVNGISLLNYGVSGSHDVVVSWGGASGASGYRVVGAQSASGIQYETTGTSFYDSGVGNISGAMSPTLSGANLFLDVLSNLYLAGRMFINGCKVMTECDMSGLTGNPLPSGLVTGVGINRFLAQWTSASGIGSSDIYMFPGSTPPYYQADSVGFRAYQHLYGIAEAILLSGVDILGVGAELVYLSSNWTGSPTGSQLSFNTGTGYFNEGETKLFLYRSGSLMVPSSGITRLQSDWVPQVSGEMLALYYDGSSWLEQWRYPAYTGFLSGVRSSQPSGTPYTVPIFNSSGALSDSSVSWVGVGNVFEYQTNDALHPGMTVRGYQTLNVVTGLNVDSTPNEWLAITAPTGSSGQSSIVTISGAGYSAGTQKIYSRTIGNFIIPSSGIVKLASDWEPTTSGEFLKVTFDGTNWYEEYRFPPLSGQTSSPTGANPTALVGLSAVNGSSSTFMRSDAAPGLDTSISPGWSGRHTFRRSVQVGNFYTGFTGLYPNYALLIGPTTGSSSWGIAAGLTGGVTANIDWFGDDNQVELDFYGKNNGAAGWGLVMYAGPGFATYKINSPTRNGLLVLDPSVASNSASAGAYVFDTQFNLTGATDKLATWYNSGVLKAYIDKDGNFSPSPTGFVSSSQTGSFVTTGQTGAFLDSGVANTIYYPRTNPSGYIMTGSLSSFEAGSGLYPTGTSASYFVPFIGTFAVRPIVTVQIERATNAAMVSWDITGVVTTGFWLNLSDAPGVDTYRYGYMASTGISRF